MLSYFIHTVSCCRYALLVLKELGEERLQVVKDVQVGLDQALIKSQIDHARENFFLGFIFRQIGIEDREVQDHLDEGGLEFLAQLRGPLLFIPLVARDVHGLPLPALLNLEGLWGSLHGEEENVVYIQTGYLLIAGEDALDFFILNYH